MKKKLLSMLLVLCMALAMLPITALTAADAPAGLSDIRPAEWNVLRLTNIERHNEGQFSLVTFAKMQKYAQIRSDELIKKFSHTRPDGRSCFTVFNDNGFSCSSAAENIAMGQQTAEEVVTGWMNSSGHRANILRENLRYMGVGVTVESSIYWAQYFANNKGSDCKNISFDPNGRYFTLVLENGTTAFAPYDENSVNLKGNKMQFNYPGADTWFDKPGAGEIADELIDPSSPKPDDKPDDTPKDGATPISVTEFGKMLHYAGEDIGSPFLVYYDGNSGAVSGMMRPAVMKTANELGLHIYSMNADLIDSRGNTGLWYLTKYMPELVGKTVNVPSIIYFDGKDIRISSLSDPDFPTANAGNFDKLLKKWGITGNYSAFNPVGEYPDYDFKITSLKGISGAGIQVGNGIDDVKPVFTDGISRPYTLTSSNSSVVKINAAGTGFDVLKIGTATVTATVSNKPWYTKTFSV
ncbi:MAG: CAP domain-containing protein, partial [Clostridia bacterium]